MLFESQSSEFTLCYQPDVTITQPTIIFANFDSHYPNGMVVKVNQPDNSGVTVRVVKSTSDNTVTVYATASASATVVGDKDVEYSVSSNSTDTCVVFIPRT